MVLSEAIPLIVTAIISVLVALAAHLDVHKISVTPFSRLDLFFPFIQEGRTVEREG